jgi:acyl-CoA synthetase (NDP forming)
MPKQATRYIDEFEGKRLLASYGVTVPAELVAASPTAAAELAAGMGFPVVLKVISKDVAHKTEAGGVRLNLGSPAEVKAAAEEILRSVRAHHPAAEIEGLLVAEQVEVEHELFIGMVRDAQFGPVIAFGLGGIFVEVLKDVAFGITPLERIDALEMIREIRGYAVIAGARGRRPVDEERLADTLLAVARLATEHPEIAELDINPLAATEDGRLVALDCLLQVTAAGQ